MLLRKRNAENRVWLKDGSTTLYAATIRTKFMTTSILETTMLCVRGLQKIKIKPLAGFLYSESSSLFLYKYQMVCKTK